MINVKGIMSFEISAEDMESALDLANDKEFLKSLITIDGFKLTKIDNKGVTSLGNSDFDVEVEYVGTATPEAYKLLTVLSSTIESWI